MAIFHDDEDTRLKCPKCNSKYIIEKKAYSYEEINKNLFKATEITTLLSCLNCGEFIKEIGSTSLIKYDKKNRSD